MEKYEKNIFEFVSVACNGRYLCLIDSHWTP